MLCLVANKSVNTIQYIEHRLKNFQFINTYTYNCLVKWISSRLKQGMQDDWSPGSIKWPTPISWVDWPPHGGQLAAGLIMLMTSEHPV